MTTSTYFYKLKEQAVTIELFFSIVQEHRQTFEETTLLENIDNLLKKQQYWALLWTTWPMPKSNRHIFSIKFKEKAVDPCVIFLLESTLELFGTAVVLIWQDIPSDHTDGGGWCHWVLFSVYQSDSAAVSACCAEETRANIWYEHVLASNLGFKQDFCIGLLDCRHSDMKWLAKCDSNSQVAQNVDVVLTVNENSWCASQCKPPRRSTGRTWRGTESLFVLSVEWI